VLDFVDAECPEVHDKSTLAMKRESDYRSRLPMHPPPHRLLGLARLHRMSVYRDELISQSDATLACRSSSQNRADSVLPVVALLDPQANTIMCSELAGVLEGQHPALDGLAMITGQE
jgi:hypothetical protein